MQRSKLGIRKGSFFFNGRYTDILKLLSDQFAAVFTAEDLLI